ncbi:MAG TPA: hypothetical protein VF540_04870, partial [Segetibacter sp.]
QIAIKEYSATPSNYLIGQTIPVSDTNTDKVNFVWVDGGNGRKVTYTATVNGITVSADATFNVNRPTTVINASSTAQTATGVNPASNDLEVHLGVDAYNPGIKFVRGNTTAQPGDFQWVQIIDSLSVNFHDLQGTSQSISKTSVLDKVYPYDTANNTFDVPGWKLSGSSISVNWDVTWSMYLMYKPTGKGNEWVPLRKVTWRWAWSSVQNNGVWQTTVVTEPRNQNLTDQDTTAHPTWNSVY